MRHGDQAMPDLFEEAVATPEPSASVHTRVEQTANDAACSHWRQSAGPRCVLNRALAVTREDANETARQETAYFSQPRSGRWPGLLVSQDLSVYTDYMGRNSAPNEVAGALRVSIGLLVRRLRQAKADGDLTLPESTALAR